MTDADRRYLDSTLKVLRRISGLTDVQRVRLLRTEANKLGSPTVKELNEYIKENNLPL